MVTPPYSAGARGGAYAGRPARGARRLAVAPRQRPMCARASSYIDAPLRDVDVAEIGLIAAAASRPWLKPRVSDVVRTLHRHGWLLRLPLPLCGGGIARRTRAVGGAPGLTGLIGVQSTPVPIIGTGRTSRASGTPTLKAIHTCSSSYRASAAGESRLVLTCGWCLQR